MKRKRRVTQHTSYEVKTPCPVCAICLRVVGVGKQSSGETLNMFTIFFLSPETVLSRVKGRGERGETTLRAAAIPLGNTFSDSESHLYSRSKLQTSDTSAIKWLTCDFVLKSVNNFNSKVLQCIENISTCIKHFPKG